MCVCVCVWHARARAAQVTTAADIAISLWPRAGVSHTIGVPGNAPTRAAAAQRHDARASTFDDGTCAAEAAGTGTASLLQQRTPTEQFGPNEWVIWPVAPGDRAKYFGAADQGATHYSAPPG